MPEMRKAKWAGAGSSKKAGSHLGLKIRKLLAVMVGVVRTLDRERAQTAMKKARVETAAFTGGASVFQLVPLRSAPSVESGGCAAWVERPLLPGLRWAA